LLNSSKQLKNKKLLSFSSRLLDWANELYSSSIILYSSSDNTFIAISNVLNPCMEKSFIFSHIYSSKGYEEFLFKRAFIILSAPFINTLITPICLITMLILFLVESNSNIFNNSTRSFLPLTSRSIEFAEDPMKTYPKCLAKSTNVISSGEGPWYTISFVG